MSTARPEWPHTCIFHASLKSILLRGESTVTVSSHVHNTLVQWTRYTSECSMQTKIPAVCDAVCHAGKVAYSKISNGPSLVVELAFPLAGFVGLSANTKTGKCDRPTQDTMRKRHRRQTPIRRQEHNLNETTSSLFLNKMIAKLEKTQATSLEGPSTNNTHNLNNNKSKKTKTTSTTATTTTTETTKEWQQSRPPGIPLCLNILPIKSYKYKFKLFQKACHL